MDYLSFFKSYIDIAPGKFPECYAFSIHKAGSTLMHKMISEVCSAMQIPAISIPDVMFREGVKPDEWNEDPALLKMIVPGRIYYGFRYLPKILLNPQIHLAEKQCVLLVRDPRDALVSQYYSFGGKHISHRLPGKNKESFLKQFKTTEDLEIDEYVLRIAANYLKKLTVYQSGLDFNRVLLRRYEEIYYNKGRFLLDIFNHFGISVPTEVIEQVAAQNDIRPVEENISKHIRKGTPGDHREKLKTETIAKLNDIFRDTCCWYGYDLDA